MYGSLTDMRCEYGAKVQDAKDLYGRCKADDRGFTDAERKKFDVIEAEVTSLTRAIRAEEMSAEAHTPLPRVTDQIQPTTTPHNEITRDGMSATGTMTLDRAGAGGWPGRGGGRHAVSAGESVRSLFGLPAPTERTPRIGDLIAGMLGRTLPEPERRYLDERRALGETVNTAGGFLVNDELSAQVIDSARNKSRMIEAGMQTIAHTSDRFEIARVTGDPAMSIVSENSTIPEGSVTFDRIGFTPVKIGTVLKVANELIADAGNLPRLIEQILSESLATFIDLLVITGSDAGEAEPAGMIAAAAAGDITVTDAATGSPTFDDILDARKDVANNNGEPTAVILSPTNMNTLSKIQDTANNYIIPPPRAAELSFLETKQMPDAEIFVGGFENVILALRSAPRIFTSADIGMEADQTWIRILTRVSFGFARPAQIAALRGVT